MNSNLLRAMFASQVTQSKSTLMVMINANKDLKKMEKTIVAICDKNY